MDVGGLPRVQRRVTSVRKRSLPPGHSYLTPDSKKRSPRAEDESPGQNEDTGSDEDLFGDYDSFANDSLLAQVDDLEDRWIKSSTDHTCTLESKLNTKLVFGDPPQRVGCRDSLSVEGHQCTLKTASSDVQKCTDGSEDVLRGIGGDFIDELEGSQVFYCEDTSRAFVGGCKEAVGVTRAQLQMLVSDEKVDLEPRLPGVTSATPRPGDLLATNTDDDCNRRRSLKDHLKNTLAGNAKVQTPKVSRARLLKDAILSEEIDVAKKTIEHSSDVDLGPFYGLPRKVRDLIAQQRGIKKLYDWQHSCLTLESLQQRKNLIYSLPTSGGKTLVAEIVILQELLCRQRNVLMILPYVAIVQEKVRGLSSFGVELDFFVEEYAGSKGRFPPTKRRSKNSLYIATIEKGHSLTNSLIEAGRISDLGLVVIDELHMLGEGSRGAILEMTLAKILYMSKTTQIIGMSATLNNVGDLQKFMQAEYYTNNFRPVELKEFVKVRDSIYEVDKKAEDGLTFSRLLNYKYSSSMQKLDPDHLIALVTEVIPNNSCLVFCPTKKNCENVAEMVCKYLSKAYLSLKQNEKETLIKDLRSTGDGILCPVLKRTIPFGLAYHHSGLTSDERKLVEEAYSAGVLCLLTCTSTLAAGVNLPARRVILRAPYVARDFLKRAQYKQMIGRAGRAGIDTSGESILIIQEKDKKLVQELVSSPLENCYSNLLNDSSKGVQSLCLSLIGLKIAKTPEEIYNFMCSTLFNVQQELLSPEKSLWDITRESLNCLTMKGLITNKPDEDTDGPHQLLEVSKLGQATYKGGVDLSCCDILYRDLKQGLEGLVLESFLHLIYLVTPYDMISQCTPNWMIYFGQFNQLTATEQKMAASVGVPESFLARKIAGQPVKKELEEFWCYKALLLEVTKKLTYCVKAELIPLMEVAGVLEARAKQLFNSGYTTLAHLANADPETMVKMIEHMSRRQAKQIVSSAKMLLSEKAEALQEEVEELLKLPTDLPGLNIPSEENKVAK